MSKININYKEVYAKTKDLENHINNDLLASIQSEYKIIQSISDAVDSSANEALKEVISHHLEKSVSTAKALSRLLEFMNNSAKAFEENDNNIAKSIKK